jgi:hypothetical protein
MLITIQTKNEVEVIASDMMDAKIKLSTYGIAREQTRDDCYD